MNLRDAIHVSRCFRYNILDRAMMKRKIGHPRTAGESPFLSLPVELLDHILSFLHGKELFECRAVCREWKVWLDEHQVRVREEPQVEVSEELQHVKGAGNQETSWRTKYVNKYPPSLHVRIQT